MILPKNAMAMATADAVHVHIRANPKFHKIGKEATLRDLANQIAQLLYGKNYGTGVNGALGARQRLLSAKHALRDKIFNVHLQEIKDMADDPKGRGATLSGTAFSTTRGYSTILKDINSMITHAKSDGLMFQFI